MYFFGSTVDSIFEEEYMSATEVTCEHLRTFYRDFFEQNTAVEFLSLNCDPVAAIFDSANAQARLTLDLDIRFGEGADLVPKDALFPLFFTAMNPPSNEDVILLLQALGGDNFFSTTVSTTLEQDLDSGGEQLGRVAGQDSVLYEVPQQKTSNTGLVAAMLVVSLVTAISMVGMFYVRAQRNDEIAKMTASRIDSMSASLQSYSSSSSYSSSTGTVLSGPLISRAKSAISSVYEYSVPAGGHFDDEDEESEIIFVEDERIDDPDSVCDAEDEDDSIFSRPFRVDL